jgi:hypothetical protein
MAARTQRVYDRHPGLADAARTLGVTYSHLRRVVVTRERPSPDLEARYDAFKRSQQPNP